MQMLERAKGKEMSKQEIGRAASEEAYIEQLERLRLMASGDPTWDLSDNDRAALSSVLGRLDECERLIGTPKGK